TVKETRRRIPPIPGSPRDFGPIGRRVGRLKERQRNQAVDESANRTNGREFTGNQVGKLDRELPGAPPIRALVQECLRERTGGSAYPGGVVLNDECAQPPVTHQVRRATNRDVAPRSGHFRSGPSCWDRSVPRFG